MCVAAIGLIGSLAGTAVSAAGAMASANAQANAMEREADYQDQQARLKRRRGAFQAAREDRKNRGIAARQRNIAANSGVSLDSFSDVFEYSSLEGDLDEQAIRFSAESEAMSHNQQAAIKRSEAGAVRQAGGINALSSMFSGLGNIGGRMWR